MKKRVQFEHFVFVPLSGKKTQSTGVDAVIDRWASGGLHIRPLATRQARGLLNTADVAREKFGKRRKTQPSLLIWIEGLSDRCQGGLIILLR